MAAGTLDVQESRPRGFHRRAIPSPIPIPFPHLLPHPPRSPRRRTCRLPPPHATPTPSAMCPPTLVPASGSLGRPAQPRRCYPDPCAISQSRTCCWWVPALFGQVEEYFTSVLGPGFGKPQNPSSPVPCTDGRFLAFTGEVLRALEGREEHRILVTDHSDSSGPQDDRGPAWSPEGTRLTFLSDRRAKRSHRNPSTGVPSANWTVPMPNGASTGGSRQRRDTGTVRGKRTLWSQPVPDEVPGGRFGDTVSRPPAGGAEGHPLVSRRGLNAGADACARDP